MPRKVFLIKWQATIIYFLGPRILYCSKKKFFCKEKKILWQEKNGIVTKPRKKSQCHKITKKNGISNHSCESWKPKNRVSGWNFEDFAIFLSVCEKLANFRVFLYFLLNSNAVLKIEKNILAANLCLGVFSDNNLKLLKVSRKTDGAS